MAGLELLIPLSLIVLGLQACMTTLAAPPPPPRVFVALFFKHQLKCAPGAYIFCELI